MGLIPASEYHQSVVSLAAGDLLILFTDGINEAENEAGYQLGLECLLSMARSLPLISATDAGEALLAAKSGILLAQLSQTLDQNSDNIDGLLENMRMTAENLAVLTETVAYSPASLIRGVKASDRQPGEIHK